MALIFGGGGRWKIYGGTSTQIALGGEVTIVVHKDKDKGWSNRQVAVWASLTLNDRVNSIITLPSEHTHSFSRKRCG